MDSIKSTINDILITLYELLKKHEIKHTDDTKVYSRLLLILKTMNENEIKLESLIQKEQDLMYYELSLDRKEKAIHHLANIKMYEKQLETTRVNITNTKKMGVQIEQIMMNQKLVDLQESSSEEINKILKKMPSEKLQEQKDKIKKTMVEVEVHMETQNTPFAETYDKKDLYFELESIQKKMDNGKSKMKKQEPMVQNTKTQEKLLVLN